MNLKEIEALQAKFDLEHFPKLAGAPTSDEARLERLVILVLSALGELGELANIVKKINRGNHEIDPLRDAIKDEVADVFIYLLKIAQTMDIDLEQAYLEKLAKNQGRFPIQAKDDMNNSGININLLTIKSNTADSIRSDVASLCHGLEAYQERCAKLIEIGKRHSLSMPDNKTDVFYASVMAIITADVGRQYDHYLRAENLSKIQSLWAERKISDSLVHSLSVYWEDLYRVIFPGATP